MEISVQENLVTNKDSEKVSGIINRVITGLSINQLLPRLTEKKRYEIATTIAQSYSDCCLLLEIPDSALFEPLPLNDPDIAREVSARMIERDNQPIMQFNLKYINQYGISNDELVIKTAHETFHQMEKVRYPNLTNRKGDHISGRILSPTLNNQSEKGANLFAAFYFTHQKDISTLRRMWRHLYIFIDRTVNGY